MAAWQVPGRPVYLSVVPMFHCNGWGHLWRMAILGGTMVFATSDAPDTPFTPALQVMTAGAPPPPVILKRMAALGMEVMHVYGLTETFGHISQCLPQDSSTGLDAGAEADHRARQGVALPIVERVAVLGRETGKPVPRDGEAQGEIAIPGNAVMKGQYKDQGATDAAMHDGHFWSGDAAVVHDDGYMQIRDRLKDVIVSGGENVPSVEVEVEAALNRHPDVLAAVVGRLHLKWGEAPCAFVELRPGAEPNEAGIIAFCRQRPAGFKVPKSVIFEEIPKTSTGKIQEFQLRNRIKDME